MSFPAPVDSPRPWPEMLVPMVPGAGLDFIEQNLVWVLRDFCHMGTAWIAQTDVIVMTSAAIDYVIPTPVDGTTISVILALQDLDGQTAYFPADRATLFARAGQQTRGFSCLSPGTVRLLQPVIPPAEAQVRALVSLMPNSFEVPSWFRDHYQPSIETGVMGRMFMMPNRPFTDLKAGMLLWRQYLNHRNIARIQAQRAYTPQGQGWVFPRFGV